MFYLNSLEVIGQLWQFWIDSWFTDSEMHIHEYLQATIGPEHWTIGLRSSRSAPLVLTVILRAAQTAFAPLQLEGFLLIHGDLNVFVNR